MKQFISLPYAGKQATFTAEELINHFKTKKINYIIIGATHVTLSKHSKPKSLDVWFRNHKNVIGHEDTCQAVGSVITKLISLDPFSKGIRKCPTSNRMCKALIFSEK